MPSRVTALNSLVLFAALCSALPGNAFSAPLFLANNAPINEVTFDDTDSKSLATETNATDSGTMVHSLPQAIPGSRYAAQLSIPPGLGYPFAKCELLGNTPRWLTLDCATLQCKGKVPAADQPASRSASSKTVTLRSHAGRPESQAQPLEGLSVYRVMLRLEDSSGNIRSYSLSLRVSSQPEIVSLEEPAVTSPKRDLSAVSLSGDTSRQSSKSLPRAAHTEDHRQTDPSSRQITESDSSLGDTREVAAVSPLDSTRDIGATPASQKVSDGDASAALLATSVAQLKQPRNAVHADARLPGSMHSTEAGSTASTSTVASPEDTKPQITSSLVPESKVIAGTGTKTDTVTVKRSAGGNLTTTVSADGTWSVAVPQDAALHAAETLTPSANGNTGTTVTVQPKYRFGDDTHAIIGFEQAGGSGAASAQKFFFDFYINRPLPYKHGSYCVADIDKDKDPTFVNAADSSEQNCDHRFHWWGNVRIASYPSTYTDPVSSFVAGFITNVGNIPINKVAQSAEFLTGAEYVIKSTQFPVMSRSENSRSRYSLALFAGFGATLPQDATDTGNYHIYYTPTTSSPQYDLFNKEFPGITSQYVAFVPPDRNLFYKQYVAGIRYTTHFADAETGAPLSSPPALVSVGIGQNEQVTQGVLRGVTARFDAFYPLPIGQKRMDSNWQQAFSGVYLFGVGELRLAHSATFPPLVLQTAPPDTNAYDNDVSLVPIRLNRDLYMIGVGIDAIKVVSGFTTKMQ